MNKELRNLIIEQPHTSNERFIGYVYVFINNTNQKIYIGKTIELYSKRWNEHKYNAFTKNLDNYFYKALRKYSWNSFSKYVIFQSEESLDKDFVNSIICAKEMEFIAKFQANNPEFGYNLTDGGEGIVGFHHSEETKKKLSKAHSGENHWNFGKTNSAGVSIMQFDLDFNFIQTWDSMQDAARELNINANNISRCCSNKIGSYKGYIWVKTSDYYEGYLLDFKSRCKCKSNDKYVLQYDFLGNFIAEYISCSEAGKALRKGSVSTAANGRDPQLHGYIWIYKNEFTKQLLQEKLERVKSCKNYNKIIKTIRDYE